MYFLSFIHDFPSQTTDRSYKDRRLFQTHQNLSQEFGFFPQHLPYSLFFLQLEKTRNGKVFVKIQLMLRIHHNRNFFLFLLLRIYCFLLILISFQVLFSMCLDGEYLINLEKTYKSPISIDSLHWFQNAGAIAKEQGKGFIFSFDTNSSGEKTNRNESSLAH